LESKRLTFWLEDVNYDMKSDLAELHLIGRMLFICGCSSAW